MQQQQRRNDSSTSTDPSGLASVTPSSSERFITPSVHLSPASSSWLDVPLVGGSLAGECAGDSPSASSRASAHSMSTGTATHATLGTAMELHRSVSLDASTNTIAPSYLHPHASVFAAAAAAAQHPTAARHFLSVLGPSSASAATADPIAGSSSAATPAAASSGSCAAAGLQTALLSIKANKLLTSFQPTYLSSLAREQVFRYIQGLVYQLDPSLDLFSYGSVPLKTYLPAGDIDIGVVLSGRFAGGHSSTATQSFLLKLKACVEQEAAREKSAYLSAVAAHHAAGGVGQPVFHSSPYGQTYSGGLNLSMRMELTHLNFVNAPEVKVLKLQYNNSLLIDISVNTTSALATVCWIEEMEREFVRALMVRDDQERRCPPTPSTVAAPFARLLDGRSPAFHHHILKRSILLVKAWSTYESRTLASAHALLSTYALEILVIYVMQHFPALCVSPLHVLYVFLAFYSREWNWEKHALSLGGPVVLEQLAASGGVGVPSMFDRATSDADSSDHPACADQPEYHPPTLLEVDLLTKLCAKYARKTNSSTGGGGGVSEVQPLFQPANPLQDEIDATCDPRFLCVSTSTSTSAGTATQPAMWSASAIPKTFAIKHANIIDPLDPSNNLGKSVNFASFLRIKGCWKKGADELEKVFARARTAAEEIDQRETEGERHTFQSLENLLAASAASDKQAMDLKRKVSDAASNSTPAAAGSSPLVASCGLSSHLSAFRASFSRFFLCTHRRCVGGGEAGPNNGGAGLIRRPDLCGLHAEERKEGEVDTGRLDRGGDKEGGRGAHTRSKQQPQPPSKKSSSSRTSSPAGSVEDSGYASGESCVSSINSRTSSPTVHPVLNLGPGAIDRLARASSSFPTSAFTSSSAYAGGPMMHLGPGELNLSALGMGASVMPAGSVSQPASLPSSPPSTPPARSSLPPSPTLASTSTPFPTPMPHRAIAFLPHHGSFSPVFRSPFRVSSTSPHLHAPRSILTQSPNAQGFMLSPGVHGMAGAAGATMAMLPPQAAREELPRLTSFLEPPTNGTEGATPPTAAANPLLVDRLDGADDSAADSDATVASTASSSRRPFILSQLQEASHRRRQTDESGETSLSASATGSISHSPLIVAATSSATPPQMNRTVVPAGVPGDSVADRSGPLVSPASMSAPPLSSSTAGKLSADAPAFEIAGYVDEAAVIGADGVHSVDLLSSASEEGVMDPLYNDLTDLQHQYNFLRYLVTSFHGSGSHTHTSHQPRGRTSGQLSPRHTANERAERATGPSADQERKQSIDSTAATKAQAKRERKAALLQAQAQAGVAAGDASSSTKSAASSKAGAKQQTQQQWAKRETTGGEAIKSALTSAASHPTPSAAANPPRARAAASSAALPPSQTPPPPFSQQESLLGPLLTSSRSSSPPMMHITNARVQKKKQPGGGTTAAPSPSQGTPHPHQPVGKKNSAAHQNQTSDADDESTPLASPLPGHMAHSYPQSAHGPMLPYGYSMPPPQQQNGPHGGGNKQPYANGPAFPMPQGMQMQAPYGYLPPPFPASTQQQQQQSFNPALVPRGPNGAPVQGGPNLFPFPMLDQHGHPMQMPPHPQLNSFHHSLLQAPTRGPFSQQYAMQQPNGPAGGPPQPQQRPSFAQDQSNSSQYQQVNQYTPAMVVVPNLGFVQASQQHPHHSHAMAASHAPPHHLLASHSSHPPLSSSVSAPGPSLSWAQNLSQKFGSGLHNGPTGEGVVRTATAPKRTPAPSPTKPQHQQQTPAATGGPPKRKEGKQRDLFGARPASANGGSSVPAAGVGASSGSSSSSVLVSDDGWQTIAHGESKKKAKSAAPSVASTPERRQPPTVATHNGGSTKNGNWRASREPPPTTTATHTPRLTTPTTLSAASSDSSHRHATGAAAGAHAASASASSITPVAPDAHVPATSLWRVAGSGQLKQALQAPTSNKQ